MSDNILYLSSNGACTGMSNTYRSARNAWCKPKAKAVAVRGARAQKGRSPAHVESPDHSDLTSLRKEVEALRCLLTSHRQTREEEEQNRRNEKRRDYRKHVAAFMQVRAHRGETTPRSYVQGGVGNRPLTPTNRERECGVVTPSQKVGEKESSLTEALSVEGSGTYIPYTRNMVAASSPKVSTTKGSGSAENIGEQANYPPTGGPPLNCNMVSRGNFIDSGNCDLPMCTALTCNMVARGRSTECGNQNVCGFRNLKSECADCSFDFGSSSTKNFIVESIKSDSHNPESREGTDSDCRQSSDRSDENETEDGDLKRTGSENESFYSTSSGGSWSPRDPLPPRCCDDLPGLTVHQITSLAALDSHTGSHHELKGVAESGETAPETLKRIIADHKNWCASFPPEEEYEVRQINMITNAESDEGAVVEWKQNVVTTAGPSEMDHDEESDRSLVETTSAVTLSQRVTDQTEHFEMSRVERRSENNSSDSELRSTLILHDQALGVCKHSFGESKRL